MNTCNDYVDRHKQLIEQIDNLQHYEALDLYTPLTLKTFGNGNAYYMIEFYIEHIDEYINATDETDGIAKSQMNDCANEVVGKCKQLTSDVLLASMMFSNGHLDLPDIDSFKNKYNSLLHEVNYSVFLKTVLSPTLNFIDVMLNHILVEKNKHKVFCRYGRLYFNDEDMFFNVVGALDIKDFALDNLDTDICIMSIGMPPNYAVAYMMRNGLHYTENFMTETHCITLDLSMLLRANMDTLISLIDHCKELVTKNFMKPSICELVHSLIAQKALDSGTNMLKNMLKHQRTDVYLSEHTDDASLAHFLFKWHDYIVQYKKLTRPKDLPNDWYKNKR